VKELQPLAVRYVGTPPRDVFDVPRVYQADLKSALFQNLKQIQYTPVDSIATVLMPQDLSQSASEYRSCVKVGNERTFSLARSAGTATKISVAPTSMPAASERMIGSAASLAHFCLLPFFLAICPPVSKDDGPGRAKRALS